MEGGPIGSELKFKKIVSFSTYIFKAFWMNKRCHALYMKIDKKNDL